VRVTDTPLHCRHPRDLDIEGEIAIARGAHAEGDWKHALHHYANALGLNPLASEAATAVRRIQTEHDALGHLEQNHYVGAHIARAYLLADAGKRDEALAIASQVDVALPELGAVQLMLEWFDPNSATAENRRALYSPLGGAGQIGLGRMQLLPGERAAIAPYAELAARLAPVEDDATVVAVGSAILRRAGRYPEALELAERASALGGSTAKIPVALAHRVGGKPELAIEIFQDIFERTGEPIYLLEKARALGDARLFGDARAAVERASELSGSAPDAEGQIFLDWLDACAAGDPVALGRSYDWVRREACWQHRILEMADASTNMLDDPRIARGSKMKVGVSCLESPSARLCLALHQGAGADPRAVEYTFQEVPDPDPRVPRRKVKTLLWEERDGVMVQAVGAPSDEVRALVAEVAAVSEDLLATWEAAERLAPRVRDRVSELAHAMVHPPDPPSEETSLRWWLYHCQVAAACLIARSDTRWSGSERRQVLLDLLRGPADWSTAAVVLALGEVAVHEPDALPEIRHELIALANAIPEGGYCSYAPTLAVTVTKIPLFRPELVQKLETRWLASDESEPQTEEESEPEEPEAPHKPWWKFWG
jgi:tetratricopeptide (TPR) repeat protein